MLTHLRRNVVAYLALLVALTTGTAYAAEELPKKLPKHSVGAKQLKKNAVSTDKVKDGSLTGADVQDGSLGLADLSAAAVPRSGWAGAKMGPGPAAGSAPNPAPDVLDILNYDFVLPRPGTVLVKLDLEYITGGCPAGGGSAYVALYVDGVPVPGTRLGVSSEEGPRYLAGAIPVSAAGSHRASLGYDCPSTSGGLSGYGLRYYTWSLVLGQ